MHIPRRSLLAAFGAVAALGLSACSGPYSISSEVSSFGSWPESRKPGSFAFERLPSQAQAGAIADNQARIEASARAALLKAGFTEAADAKSADVLVSLGMRVDAQDRAPWDDPLWWRWQGSYSHWRYGGLGRIGMYHPSDMLDRRYDRSVAVLLRDRQSAEPLYEARASNEGMTQGPSELAGALFEAALSDFPKVRPEPHRVVVQAIR
jgi:hypothetical protein